MNTKYCLPLYCSYSQYHSGVSSVTVVPGLSTDLAVHIFLCVAKIHSQRNDSVRDFLRDRYKTGRILKSIEDRQGIGRTDTGQLQV